ncbi:MAG: hypothetical protein RLZZ517_517 [Candidatus Parcubacteria bacterium]|jgi:branched-chain amino acid transport system substrate-binding protein
MNKKIVSILVIILLAVAVFFVFNSTKTNNTEKPTVKIGVTLPLTGDVALLGQSSKKAIELALENLGDTKYNYQVVFEDDQFKTQVGATVANKLINVDKVDMLFSFGSPVGNVVNPIAEAQKVPHLNFFASDTKVANGEYNFLHYTPPYMDVQLFMKELKKRNIKNLVFFEISDNPGAAAIAQAFEKELPNNPEVNVLATQKFKSGTRDFRTLISEVKDKPADILVLQSSSPELETLYKQIREAGITTPVTSIETFEFANEIGLFEGSWYINAADPQEWYVDAYTKKYNESPKFGSAHAYDGVNLVVKAIESIGDGKTVPTHDQIKDAIKNIKSFDGAVGKNLKFDSDGQLVSGAVVREIKDGKPVTIK